MNELQWRGMRGVGSGTSRLEVEAAWVGGSCPGSRSLCRGDVLYTTERQIASSPTRKPLARSPSLPLCHLPLSLSSLSSSPFSFISFSYSVSHTVFLLRSVSPFTHLLAIPPLFARPTVPPCVRRAVPYPPVASLSSAHSSFSVHLPVFFRSTVSPRERARVPLAKSLSVLVVRLIGSYLAVLRRGSGYARRLRQRLSCGTFYQEFQCHVCRRIGRTDVRTNDRLVVSCRLVICQFARIVLAV